MTSSRRHPHSAFGTSLSSTTMFFVNPLPIPDYSDTSDSNSETDLPYSTSISMDNHNYILLNSMNTNFIFRPNFQNNNNFLTIKQWKNRTRSQSPIKNFKNNNNNSNMLNNNNNYNSYPSLQLFYTADELLTLIQPVLRHAIMPLIIPSRALQKREIIGKGKIYNPRHTSMYCFYFNKESLRTK